MRKKETEPCDSNSISNESNLNNTKMTTTTNNENATNQTKPTIATHDSTTQTTCKQDLFTVVSIFAPKKWTTFFPFYTICLSWCLLVLLQFNIDRIPFLYHFFPTRIHMSLWKMPSSESQICCTKFIFDPIKFVITMTFSWMNRKKNSTKYQWLEYIVTILLAILLYSKKSCTTENSTFYAHLEWHFMWQRMSSPIMVTICTY